MAKDMMAVVAELFPILHEVETQVEDVVVETHPIQTPLIDPMTVEEARNYVLSHWDEGTSCPCCGQRVQRYARPITSSMAWGLCRVYEYFQDHPDETWVHVEKLFTEMKLHALRGDFAKLRYWGFVEMNEEAREDGNPNNGHWKITERGIAFVRGEVSVPSHVYLYDGHALGFSETYISIRDALKNKFDYDQMIAGSL